MQQSRLRIVVFTIFSVVLILTSLLVASLLSEHMKNYGKPSIVIRVDDVQDYAFWKGQLFLLNQSIKSGIPLSLAVIAGEFGSDGQVVEEMKQAIGAGCEVTVHGWHHEDFSALTVVQQMKLLFQAKSLLKEVLNVTASVFVPPMYTFNDDTLRALKEEDFSVLSTGSFVSDESVLSGLVNIPATVELSSFSTLENGQDLWRMKSIPEIMTEIATSVEVYGYVVIVTHPQEFLFSEESLNRTRCDLYSVLLETLSLEYSFTTLQTLAEKQA